MSNTKMKKSELVNLIKECILEVKKEGYQKISVKRKNSVSQPSTKIMKEEEAEGDPSQDMASTNEQPADISVTIPFDVASKLCEILSAAIESAKNTEGGEGSEGPENNGEESQLPTA